MEKNITYFNNMAPIWNEYAKTFKRDVTVQSYKSDVIEFTDFIEKDFIDVRHEDVERYYIELDSRVRERKLAPSTMAKKIRELNSLSSFIYNHKETLGVTATYQNHFQEYIYLVEERSEQANSIPIDEINQLLTAAENDIQSYCIISMIYRMGLSSTEICSLDLSDICVYENGVYLNVKNRKNKLFVPEDVYKIILKYLKDKCSDRILVRKGEWKSTRNSLNEGQNALFFNYRGRRITKKNIFNMMRKTCNRAGITPCSAEALRNSYAFTVNSYNVDSRDLALEMGISEESLKRYRNINYIDTNSRKLHDMTKIKIELPL